MRIGSIFFLFIALACSPKGKESGDITENRSTISDTIRYGNYFKDKGINDNLTFSIIDVNNNTELTRLYNDSTYKVRMKVQRLGNYEVKGQVISNGKLQKTESQSIYLLHTKRSNGLDYLDIDFELDLKGDSVVILYRNWNDSLKTSYKDKYIGYSALGSFRISLKDYIP